jgi:Fe-S cluster assembly iron-binding protein IscA
MPLQLTARAATFARKIMTDNHLADHVIRVTVARDTGAFSLDVVDEVHFSDRAAEQHGVKVVCDPRSYLFLHDATIDYSESKGGFTFDPPSANKG